MGGAVQGRDLRGQPAPGYHRAVKLPFQRRTAYIGPSTAKKIVSMFGEDTLNVISETPQSLCRIKGITPEKAAAISNEFRRMYGVREVVAWFTKYGLSAQQAVTAYRAFGPTRWRR